MNPFKRKPYEPPYDSILKETRAQLRTHGRPVDLFVDKANQGRIDLEQGQRLILEILQSFQDRLCALEETT